MTRLVAAHTRQAALALACLLGPRSGLAHELWLAPSRYRAGPADTVAVQVFVGTGFRGDVVPYAAPRVHRFEMRAGRTLDLSRAGRNGDPIFARFVFPDAGGALLVYQSNFSQIELEASSFDAYLRAEGLDGPLAARAQRAEAGPGRERYARCCKAWIAGAQVRRVLEPVGLPLEIVPLEDPAAAGTLQVLVLYEGAPLAHALIRAWCNPDPGRNAAVRDSVGPAFEARTGSDGRAMLELDRAGEWLVSTVHMVPASSAAADWESRWASFTFLRPPSAVPGPRRTRPRRLPRPGVDKVRGRAPGPRASRGRASTSHRTNKSLWLSITRPSSS